MTWTPSSGQPCWWIFHGIRPECTTLSRNSVVVTATGMIPLLQRKVVSDLRLAILAHVESLLMMTVISGVGHADRPLEADCTILGDSAVDLPMDATS